MTALGLGIVTLLIYSSIGVVIGIWALSNLPVPLTLSEYIGSVIVLIFSIALWPFLFIIKTEDISIFK